MPSPAGCANGSDANRPPRSLASRGSTPAARTATRTCPGPGSANGTSTSRNTSGPPYSAH
ncbi:hypothetical protein OG588_14780 [Streptomyces prunicolor]|uniref:hypothetical protein n=1 Tax=Streptomyces prunicolor TaxID=67348 RepID=UPI003870C9F1|nr:hypothetical protein OG588_14780 [Streptomyces prunicolor]